MVPLPEQDSVLSVIQLSITPVILISGLGALVIAMTNRLGRIVDRTRSLATLARAAQGGDRENLEAQIKIMFRRAKIMRWAMTLIVSSMFISGLLIALLFIAGVFHLKVEALIVGVFVASVFMLLGGLAGFVADIFVSLRALRVDVTRSLMDIEGE